jgi:hypothetical protein
VPSQLDGVRPSRSFCTYQGSSVLEANAGRAQSIYTRESRQIHYLPTMWGCGESEVILYPNEQVSIRIAKAAGFLRSSG